MKRTSSARDMLRSIASSQLVRHALRPARLDRSTVLTRTERIGAITPLIASLEYLARPQDTRWGGLNDWAPLATAVRARSPRLARVCDVVARPRVTIALHCGRAALCTALLLPLPARARGPANAALAASGALLYPRLRFGTDGSDQVSFLVQTATAVGRANRRRPEVVDASIWFIALQSVMSYTVSGLVKIGGRAWRRGDAVVGVARTLNYGDPTLWRLLNHYPKQSRLAGFVVVALEAAFPAVFLAEGRLAPVLLNLASLFHLGNARIMGLGRFVWAFMSMHPAVLYASGARELVDDQGRVLERRDDLLPTMCAAGLGAFAATAAVTRTRRRSRVLDPEGFEQQLTTRSGNALAYRVQGCRDGVAPPLVFVNGLVSTPDHWQFLVDALPEERTAVTYYRAGYGPSQLATAEGYRLDDSVDDLIDLIEHVAPEHDVVLVGHSMGGYLALKAAARVPKRVRALALLDTSHPAEMTVSAQQARGRELYNATLNVMPPSLEFGLGLLLSRPSWMEDLSTTSMRRRSLDDFRDARAWTAGRREWRAMIRDFDRSGGVPPDISVPLLALTAGETRTRDTAQSELHQQLVAMAPWGEHGVIEGADHMDVLLEKKIAEKSADRLTAFVRRVEEEREAGHAAQRTA